MAAEKTRERSKIRKIMRAVLVTLAFVIGILLLVGTVTAFFVFRVKTFEFEGSSTYSHAEIEQASGVTQGSNLLFLNLQQTARQIEETLPNLVDVEIRRKLPNTLVIAYDETTMAYAVQTGENAFAVTNSGFKVLSHMNAQPEGTVLVVTGMPPLAAREGTVLSFVNDPSSTDATLQAMLGIAAAISESGAENIDEINVTDLQNLYLIYDGRVLVKLGGATQLEEKLQLCVNSMEKEDAIDTTHGGTLNLTVPGRAYFRPMKIAEMPELAAYLPAVQPKEDVDAQAPADAEDARKDEDEADDEEDDNEDDGEEKDTGNDEDNAYDTDGTDEEDT
ncbi:MAG: FtsQ-type POTRA domain-containing protein [Clostridia bacterium]|nr:FtsQ-type POTRA domain-containing protein [Clostridia bacterium]